MSDLISRSAVIKIIQEEIDGAESFAEHNTQINILSAVKNLPAYDANEVQALKDNILVRMQNFLDEYRRISNGSNYFGAKADAIETAVRIVEGAFSDFANQLC